MRTIDLKYGLISGALLSAMTFLEPLPVALIMTLVSAGLLSRRTVPPQET